MIINYFSNIIIPLIIFIIIFYGILEKKNIFDLFIDGAKEGINTALKIFPTLIGIFLAICFFQNSEIINSINFLGNKMNYIKEILPLIIIRPISGSGAIGIATNIMKNYGVDSKIGIMVSVILGATETTFYTIAIYTGNLKIKNTRKIIIPALIADIVAMGVSIFIVQLS